MSEVSNGDLLGVLLKVENRLGEMNGTMLGVKEQLQADRLRTAAIELSQNNKHQILSERLEKLERFRWMQTGAAGAVGALLSALFGHQVRWPF